MKRKFAITTVILLSSAMFFVVVSAAASGKPMRGSWSGKTYTIGMCDEITPQFLAIGKGHLNLIGAGDYVSWGCLDVSDVIPPIIWIGEGGAIITTATGDALYFDILITFTFTSPHGGTWHQVETTEGGTGRFEGATGVSSSDGTFEMTLGSPTVWEGTNTEGYINF